MAVWTEPTDVAANSVSDSDKFNTETVENLRYLHSAKAGTFGRTGALLVPNGVLTDVDWNFAVQETVPMWDVGFPERINPSVPGIWLFTVRLQFPLSAALAISVKMLQGGITVGQSTVPGLTTHTSHVGFSAQVLLDGAGDYVTFQAWQSGEAAGVTLNGGHRLDCTWLGDA